MSVRKAIVFFDDEKFNSENQSLRRRLSDRFSPRFEIRSIFGFHRFRDEARYPDVACVILDIMAATDGAKDARGRRVRESRAGIELLRQCRSGELGTHLVSVPVVMRSARAEDAVRHACYEAGCTGYFLPEEDTELLGFLDEVLA